LNGNRTLLVPAGDTIVKLICFSECDTCTLTGSAETVRKELFLSQNFPNPTTENTTIGYGTTRAGFLKLAVYSPIGQLISILFNGPCEPGSFNLPFTTSGLPAGIYYYQMTFTGVAGTSILSKKMIVQ